MDLHTKYRPSTLDEIVGHKAVVASLEKAITAKRHAFLFAGPAGTGKTTLARIVCKKHGIEQDGLIEVNGAETNGVDHMRDLVNQVSSYAMTATGTKGVILDECHRLSKQAWDVLLKPLEEPPEHVYWFLCSTDAAKIPVPIQTRCLVYTLSELAPAQIESIILNVANAEGIALGVNVVPILVDYAAGSARRALTGLQTVMSATAEDAKALLTKLSLDTPQAIDFARIVCGKGDPAERWSRLCDMGSKMEGETTVSLQKTTLRYARKMMFSGTKTGSIYHVFARNPVDPDDIGEAFYWAGCVLFGKEP